MMDVPEYCYENKLDNFKPKDIIIFSDHLKECEEAEAKLQAERDAEA